MNPSAARCETSSAARRGITPESPFSSALVHLEPPPSSDAEASTEATVLGGAQRPKPEPSTAAIVVGKSDTAASGALAVLVAELIASGQHAQAQAVLAAYTASAPKVAPVLTLATRRGRDKR